MTVSDDDKALFQLIMKTVKPLKTTQRVTRVSEVNKPSKNTIKPLGKQNVTPPPSSQMSSNIQNSTDFYLSNHYMDVVTASSVLSYSNGDIPKKRLIELKNGQIHWEARLDLHGFRPDDARQVLCQFINKQSLNSHRCLLIIHGKGGRFGEEPVLKNHVNHWLKQLPHVLAFHSAIPKDGGTGAVYVLLKRQHE